MWGVEVWVGFWKRFGRYKELAGDLLVLPAHSAEVSEMNEDGSVSKKLSILYENNEGLQIQDEAQFIKRVTQGLKGQPNAYEEIRQTNYGQNQSARRRSERNGDRAE